MSAQSLPARESSLHAVAYVSRYRAHPGAHLDMDRLLAEARRFNDAHGITGALLFDGTCFFQFFEGPAAAVAQVHARIRQARSHQVLIEFLNGPVPCRRFEGWDMFFKATAPARIAGLDALNWNAATPPPAGVVDGDIALNSLRFFWQHAPATTEPGVEPTVH